MSLEDFNDEIKKKNLIGYWMIPNRSDGFREPQALFEPFLWKWGELYDALNRAVEHIRPEEAYRRFIGFQHPQLKMGTSHSLLMGGQLVRPGEIAPAHRHMMEAIRFVIKGKGAATIIEGEPFPMEEGDLITTPNWSWHDHINSDKSPIIWLDGANGPMIHYYQVGFANLYDQPQQTVSKPVGWSHQAYSAVRPKLFTSMTASNTAALKDRGMVFLPSMPLPRKRRLVRPARSAIWAQVLPETTVDLSFVSSPSKALGYRR